MKDILLENYYYIEMVRLNLLNEIDNKLQNDKNFIIPQNLPVIANSTAIWNGKALKITVPGILPVKTSRKSEVEKMEMQYWVSAIVSAYKRLDKKIKINNAICLILTYSPYKMKWDTDNRNFKYIIDGIRYTTIINDDDWCNLWLMLVGSVDERNPRTEIYISEAKNTNYYINKFFGAFENV